MKIEEFDICDITTLTFKLVQSLDDEANKLRKQYERIEDLNKYLVYCINNKYITDTDDIEAAIAWLNHSDLNPYEIVKRIREG